MAYRILSFDGGGMRGLISVRLLERLHERHPELLHRSDLIAGTSSGGLIALALAYGYSPERIRRLFEDEADTIFADTIFDDVANLGRLVGADYSTAGLSRVVGDLFGEARLDQLAKRVLIPTFDLDTGSDAAGSGISARRRRWKAKFLHNFPGSDSDGTVLVRQAALRTAAAPIYFPSYEGYIDGGVVASNPSTCALVQSQDRRSLRQPPDLAEVSLLSIGTGEAAQFVPGDRHDWGALQWGRPLVDIFMTGIVEVATYQCRGLLGERFARLSPELHVADRLGLDSHGEEARRRMDEIASEAPLDETLSWLHRFW